MQATNTWNGPTRPVLAFQIGVTGHRDLAEADTAALRAEAAGLFRRVGEVVVGVHKADQAAASPLYAPEAPRLRCICGLAAGADAILAEAALDEGWALVATLPFSRAEFERDFEAASALATLRALLGRATVVSELDGDRQRGGEPYEQVGEQIAEQSDLLIAIWDGKAPHGPGGAGDVVRMALERAAPVAVLSPGEPATISWRGAPPGDLSQWVGAALTPSTAAAAGFRAYLDERPRSGAWTASVVRAFETIAVLGANDASSAGATKADAAGSRAQEADLALLRCFDPADRLAIAYAARYRAAGLMRYGLILPATAGALIASANDRWLQIGGNLIQFVVLVFIVAFSAKAWREPAHQRFMAYRALAEQLRNARLLGALGAVALAPGAADGRETASDWTVWLARAIVRAIGPASMRFDTASTAAAAAFVRAQIGEQIAFLTGRATRFEIIARRLSRLGVTLSICGIAFSGLRAILLAIDVGESGMAWLNETALVLPAMAPVFLGLLSFNEYRGLTTRYRALASELRTQVQQLDSARPRRAAVLSIARRIAAVMLQESEEWRQLIKGRSVSAY
jgi:hypothetical protein